MIETKNDGKTIDEEFLLANVVLRAHISRRRREQTDALFLFSMLRHLDILKLFRQIRSL